VAYAGVELQLKDSKGLRYLAYLVGRPHQAIAVLDLAGVVSHAAEMAEGDRPHAQAGRNERARTSVTKRIKAEIRRIATIHPALGRHLAATVSTGQVCRYEPEGKPVRRRSPAAGGS
jgi:hypothetical protein